jgi:hypothetical protein
LVGLPMWLAMGANEVRCAMEVRTDPLPVELLRLLVRWRCGSRVSAWSSAAMTGCRMLPSPARVSGGV